MNYRAKRCSQAFRHRGVEVTTKHSYIIDYKYIWECTNCGQEFKRHSKSIDPARHTCGSCTSKLVQTQPTPRTAVPSNYNLFIKSNFQQTKKAHPESSQKELMGLLGQMYKEQKAAALSASEVRTDVEVIDVEEEKGVLVEDDEGDSVSRTLDFLSLVSQ